MKKIYLVLLLFTMSATDNLSAQNITPSLVGTFIEGVSPVSNSFTFDDGNSYSSILFEAVDGSGSVISSYTDATPTGTTYAWNSVDMGALDPNSKIRVTDVGSSNEIDSYDLTILAKPDWLKVNNSTAVASNINTTNHTFDVACTFDLYKYEQTITDSVKLIGGEQFGYRNDFTFNVTWNYGTPATVTGTDPNFNYTFVALSTDVYSETCNPANSSGIQFNVTLDPSFEMGFTAHYDKSKELLDKQTPKYTIPTPVPGLNISLNAGIKINGAIGMNILYGKDQSTQQYGFLRNSPTDVSSFAIGGVVSGNIEGSLSLVHEYVANVRGSLVAEGKVGLEYQYQTQPAGFQSEVKLGGQFQLSGTITTDNIARKALRWLTNQSQDPAVLYEGNVWPQSSPLIFGNGYPTALPNMIPISSNQGSRSFMSDWFFDIPVYGAQPDISTKGDSLCVVWMEADADAQYLRFAKYDPASNCFASKLVTSNDNSISNPKVSLLNNGDAIITWTQNRYDESNPPADTTDLSFDDFTDGQDIWFAIYDNQVDSIVVIEQLSDDIDINLSRSEGEATVSAGSGNEALITWVSRPKNANDADIYYTNISKAGATWNMTNPAALTSTGANYSVKVAYADATNATAVWIADTDNDDLSSNNDIMVSYWNGSQFTTPAVLVASQNYRAFNELDLDFNENYGALAYTYEVYDSTDASHGNGVGVELYDNSSDAWIQGQDFQYSDASSVFKLPRISIDESGFASLLFQRQSLVSDTTHDPGSLLIFANNIQADNNWTQVNTTTALNDPNTIVWFLNSGFTSNRDIFVLSQETDTTVGGSYSPSNGVLFGDASLGLVLRKVQIDDNNYTLIDLQEPNCVPTGIAKVERRETLMQCFPNPASGYATIEFNAEKTQNYALRIFDLTGRPFFEVLNQKLQQGNYKSVVDLSNFESGMYLYSLSTDEQVITKRFVVAK